MATPGAMNLAPTPHPSFTRRDAEPRPSPFPGSLHQEGIKKTDEMYADLFYETVLDDEVGYWKF
jgi:hypothetical protein